jgi:hypothetical protein
MAAFSNLMAFPVLNRDEINFMCIQVKTNGETYKECSPLYLNTERYWEFDDTDGWAGAIRTAALFGIVAAAGGFMAFALLASASCFVLIPRRLLSVLIMQGVCAILTLLTLVAGAADVCKLYVANSGNDCKKDESHFDTGAGFMLFACFLYIAAGVMTYFYFRKVHREHRATPIPKAETKRLIQTAAPLSYSAGVSPSGKTRKEREYVDKDGQLVKETTIEYVDEAGHLVKETTVE